MDLRLLALVEWPLPQPHQGEIMAEVSCPNCSERLNAPPIAVGKTVKCASCGHRFLIDGSQVMPDGSRAVPSTPPSSPGSFPTFEGLASQMGTSGFWRGATKVVAWIALIGGLLRMLDALTMKTTVEGVYNQGLMHERLVEVLVSGFAILSALVVLSGMALMATIRERLPLNR
jgi:DNA-directed RNA polymerase subunit RPC12/RpoP